VMHGALGPRLIRFELNAAATTPGPTVDDPGHRRVPPQPVAATTVRV